MLDRSDVLRTLEAAVIEAANNSSAVSVAVVDDGGHLLGFTRLDGGGAFADTAIGKAHTAALSGRSRPRSSRW